MGSIDTNTLIEANQLLSASIQAFDAYLVGAVRSTEADVQQMADLTCHALLLANLIASSAGHTLEGLSGMPLSRMPVIIQELKAVAAR